jgi:hypothetical protein
VTFESTIARIERAEVLDPVAQRVKAVLEPVIGNRVTSDLLGGRWLGHPVHPAAVLAPLAGWFGGTLLDVVGGTAARGASQRLIGAGTLAALPAAMAGAADWLSLGDAEERVGTVHAALADGATTLFGLSWLLRTRRHHRAAVALGLAGAAFAGATAFVGGHLSFRRGVGVSTVAFQSGPDDWTDLDLDDEPRADRPVRGVASGVPLAVVAARTSPDVAPPLHVMESRCTHRGGPLHEGSVVDGCLECPWHGARFDLATGGVRRGPAAAPEPVYETRSVDGSYQVRRDESGGLRRDSTVA